MHCLVPSFWVLQLSLFTCASAFVPCSPGAHVAFENTKEDLEVRGNHADYRMHFNWLSKSYGAGS